jgi:acyl carrier protein
MVCASRRFEGKAAFMKAYDEFQQAIAAVLEVSSEQMTLDAPFESFAAWDSLAVVSIVALVNQHFGKAISADLVQTSPTLGDVVRRVEGVDG